MRKPVLSGIAAAVFALASIVVAGPGAVAEPGGGECQLDGTAAFSPNGPGNLATFGYSLTAALSSCNSSRAGAPTQGAIAVGQVITVSVPITLADGTTTQGTAQYQEPMASGTGTAPNSCGGSNTTGTGIIDWPDGTRTVVDYTTSSAAAAVSLEGVVVPGVDATLVQGSASPAGTAPGSVALSSTSPVFPVGDTAQGLLTFSSDTPDGCTTDAGLATAHIQGVVGVGSTQ